MKNGWKTNTLSDLCSFENGDRGENYPSKSVRTPSGVPFINAGHLAGSGIDFSKMDYIPRERYELLGNGKVQRGDILFCLRGSLGKFASVGDLDEGAIASSLVIIRPTNAILPAFVLAYLQSDLCEAMIGKYKNGAAQPNLAAASLKKFRIPVPQLSEQQRIVGLLNKAFEGIATATRNAEKNLQNARSIFDSHLQSVFARRATDWSEKMVGEIAKHSLGKMLDKAKNRGERKPYLRNINVRWFTFDLCDLLQMPFLPGESDKCTAVKGDVLICEGGYPGRAAIWDESYAIHFQKALHRVRFREPEHNKWFVYYLYSQDASGQLKQFFSGAGIQHFTGEALARFNVPLPPLPELRRAVAGFDELSEQTQRLARLYERKRAALDALKQSLLHQAFTGKL